MAFCRKADVKEENLFWIANLFVASPVKGFGRALIAFLVALSAGGGAPAQIGSDCIGPSLPPELNNFASPPIPALTVSPEVRDVAEARLPIGRSVYLHLPPMSSFHPVAPFRFVTGTWRTDPVAGGFVGVTIQKSGIYWISTYENLAAIDLLPRGNAKPIEPARVLNIPCQMGLVLEYKLKAGHYRLQFVSSYLDTALIELTSVGGSYGSFVDLSSQKRRAR